MEEYPGIQERFKKPAGFEFVSFESSHGTIVRGGRLVHPEPKGSIYILQGQREFIEGWYEFISDLHKRGLSIYICERAGEGGSEKIPSNPQMSSSLLHEEHLRDFDRFIKEICPRPRGIPAVLLGNSLGGLYGLHYLKQNAGVFDRAIFSAPPFGKKVKCKRDLVIAFSAACIAKFAKKDQYIPGAHDWSWEKKSGRKSQSTHDETRTQNLLQWQRHNPQLRMGGATYGNLSAIARAMRAIKKKGFVESIETPCHILSAKDDFMVSDESHQIIAARMPYCEVTTFEGAWHNLIMEQDRWRNRVLQSVVVAVEKASCSCNKNRVLRKNFLPLPFMRARTMILRPQSGG